MTRKEKLERLEEFCHRRDCQDCVLDFKCKFDASASDEEIDRDYAIAFPEGCVKEEPKPDMVNAPPHYTHGMECIDEMIQLFGREATMNFCLLNAWKYRKRALHKNGQQDIDKSDWYIAKYVELKKEAVMDESK